MHKKLADIASITTGLYEKVQLAGDTLYLQGKHFDEYGRFREDMVIPPELQCDERIGKHLLRDGDILLISKGENNRACLYHKTIGQAVASSTFFVFRLRESNLLPAFLQWYLNTAYMQEMFAGLSKGTQIASLSKKTLADIEIPSPPLETQREILDIQGLWDKEKALTNALLNQKDVLYQHLLLNRIKSTLIK